MKHRSASLDELWEEIKYAHEQRGLNVPPRWRRFWQAIHAVLSWKADRS
jgi:hypothetical protein